jgi:hypothetical protein
VSNQVKNPDRIGFGEAATKSIRQVFAPSRRGVLAGLGGLALAAVATPAAVLATPPAGNFAVRDGWILRADDLGRLGLE